MIRTENLSIGYKDRILTENLSLEIPRGRLTVLIGRNGTGKSTLLRTLTGLSAPLSGKIFIDGKDISTMKPSEIATEIAFVGTERVRISNLECFDIVALGRAPYTDWIGRLSENDRKIVAGALETVGMSEYAHRSMDRMSDGECQKIMIARALAQDTDIIVLDEPTSFLDYPGRREALNILRDLTREHNKTILFSSHDIEMAMRIADNYILLNPPEILSGTPPLPPEALPF